MKHRFLIMLAVVIAFSAQAHEGGHGAPLKEWTLESNNTSFKAEFVKHLGNEVWLSDSSHKVLKFDLSDFTFKDQVYIKERSEMILALNTKKITTGGEIYWSNSKWAFIFTGFGFLLFSIFLFKKRRKTVPLVSGVLGIVVIVLAACSNNNTSEDIIEETDDVEETDSEENGTVPANEISFLQSVFENFTGVTTSSDETYFYVASNGLPDHNMMVGITNWQQQVPIDHPYRDDNSWAIPIQPVLAENPLSTRTNLLRGAIAVAANGIPIFNPLNNRGEDANDIGELDQWGGHCGRADDYHYHVPPTHLQTAVGDGLPIAYAVDGFPIYGETSEELDEYLGKFNEDGSYQYHTISEYPYFIAGMRGEVNLDPSTSAPENQVIPQAQTRELRPALTPLAGAEITAFESTGTNSYSLTYTLNSEEYLVNYSWDSNGLYTYEFVDPDGTSTIETYQR